MMEKDLGCASVLDTGSSKALHGPVLMHPSSLVASTHTHVKETAACRTEPNPTCVMPS